MEFSDIKIGDTIRVSRAARSKPVGFSSKRIEVPASTLVIRILSLSNVPGQPGRRTASGVVLVTEAGDVLPEPDLMFPEQPAHTELGKQRYADMRPTFEIYSDIAGVTFERA